MVLCRIARLLAYVTGGTFAACPSCDAYHVRLTEHDA